MFVSELSTTADVTVELENDQVGSSSNGSDLYSGGAQFTFWLKYQLLQVRFYMFFLIPSIHVSWYLKLALATFFHILSVLLFINHLVIWLCIVCTTNSFIK